MQRRRIGEILLMLCMIVTLPVTAGEVEGVEVARTRKPLLSTTYLFASSKMWFKTKDLYTTAHRYYLQTCQLGGGVSIHSAESPELVFSVGYEYAALTDYKAGRIDSHWMTFDMTMKTGLLFLGVECQVLCGTERKGVMSHGIAGLTPECFNKVACDAYLGVRYKNIELTMNLGIVPLLNRKQVTLNTMDNNFLFNFGFGMRFYVPVFTTGRRQDLNSFIL